MHQQCCKEEPPIYGHESGKERNRLPQKRPRIDQSEDDSHDEFAYESYSMSIEATNQPYENKSSSEKQIEEEKSAGH